MVKVIAPNGVIIEASDEAAPLLLANGYARAGIEEEAEQGEANQAEAEAEPEKKDVQKRGSRGRASRSRG